MSEYNTARRSQTKRQMLPDTFGRECPICGESFDTGSSGIFYPKESGVDVRSWVRICTGPIPDEWSDVAPTERDIPFVYVHKDEHISVKE
jgi:hypothetical protein